MVVKNLDIHAHIPYTLLVVSWCYGQESDFAFLSTYYKKNASNMTNIFFSIVPSNF